MKKQEFLNELIEAMGMKMSNYTSTGGGAGTFVTLTTAKGQSRGNACIFVDRTASKSSDRNLIIKLKGSVFHKEQEACYKSLIKFFQAKQNEGLMESVEVKRVVANSVGFSFKDGRYKEVDHNAITISMKNSECPWK